MPENDDNNVTVAIRGDEFSAFEEFEFLAISIPGTTGRGEIRSQILVQPGDEFIFMGIVHARGFRKFYDFVFTPMGDDGQIASKMRIFVHDPFIILDHVSKV